ncbi:MAG: isocitrate lyase/PEP mutase family protein [Spirochaetales bacterium]|nr:isocitrate lyase/PEP mutase family protein [Spirochaetales bacterium]
MGKKVKLRDLLSKEQLFMPCVWDCMSLKAAELSGFKAAVVGGSCFAWSHAGIPDLGMITIDEYKQGFERMTDTSPLPLIIDFEDGFGETPAQVYLSAKKMVNAGVQGLILYDTCPYRGTERGFNLSTIPNSHIEGWVTKVVPTEEYLARVKAAVKACEGSDCIVIAASVAAISPYSTLDLDEAIDRTLRAKDLGAEMDFTAIPHWRPEGNMERCRKIAKAIPGWHYYGDDCLGDKTDHKELAELGFNAIGHHALHWGSYYGMLDIGKHNFINQDTSYGEKRDRGGDFLQYEIHAIEDYRGQEWIGREKSFQEAAREAIKRHGLA